MSGCLPAQTLRIASTRRVSAAMRRRMSVTGSSSAAEALTVPGVAGDAVACGLVVPGRRGLRVGVLPLGVGRLVLGSSWPWSCWRRPAAVVSVLSSMESVSLFWAAMRALVSASAPLSTNEISLRMALRTTCSGPVKVLPLTVTLWPLGTNSASTTAAPMLACQGKPLTPDFATSRAQEVSRLTSPSAMTWPFSTATRWVWPTPWRGLWSRRTGMSWRSMARPSRSTTTGCGKPAIRIMPPV